MAGATEAEQTADYIQLLATINPIIITRPYISYLAGNAGLVTSLADLTSKINDGTATRNDYIDVAKDLGSIGVSVAGLLEAGGVLAAGTVLPWAIAIGVGLAALDYADERGYDPQVIMDDLASDIGNLLGDLHDALPDKLQNLLDSLGDALGDLLAQLPDDLVPDFLDGLLGALPGGLVPWLLNLIPDEMNPFVNIPWKEAMYLDWWISPLVLDLDGDGVETIGINSTTQVVFDHDGDGVKNGTGWVKSDDGLLVLDRNGNGVIDNGGELFGDQTIVNGIKATSGFDALRAEDTNHDGKFDSSDTNFSNVKVWQDKNSDGVSQADELHTLNELGITSINLTSTATNTINSTNNITATSTFTKADGTTATVANLNFVSNSFLSEFTNEIELDESASSLPSIDNELLVA